jgi:DNA-directed RNA polymerase subunit RPC12/RpoP
MRLWFVAPLGSQFPFPPRETAKSKLYRCVLCKKDTPEGFLYLSDHFQLRCAKCSGWTV